MIFGTAGTIQSAIHDNNAQVYARDGGTGGAEGTVVLQNFALGTLHFFPEAKHLGE